MANKKGSVKGNIFKKGLAFLGSIFTWFRNKFYGAGNVLIIILLIFLAIVTFAVLVGMLLGLLSIIPLMVMFFWNSFILSFSWAEGFPEMAFWQAFVGVYVFGHITNTIGNMFAPRVTNKVTKVVSEKDLTEAERKILLDTKNIEDAEVLNE